MVSELKRVTVTITDEAHAKVEREAADVGMTVAQFIAWLTESYEPPMEVESDV